MYSPFILIACSPAAKDGALSETDILLQKVSDTLSSALPSTSSSPLGTSVQTTKNIPDTVATKSKLSSDSKDHSNEISRSDFPADTLSSSTPNVTTNSQQDTSDYVSAMGEDLSISDWEYQLPAPPSAFRDSHSPVFDDYDTVTLGSVEAFKEPLLNHPADATDHCSRNDGSRKKQRNLKSLSYDADASCATRTDTGEKADLARKTEDDVKRATSKQSVAKQAPSSVPHKSEDPRKEMISELENKIENGTLAQTISKDLDRRSMSNESAPRIAPVDNTLSNFTITTYTKQKNLDIFDEFEESDDYATRSSDERFIKTFATLSRSNAGATGHENKSARNAGRLSNGVSSLYDYKVAAATAEGPNVSNNADCKTVPKIRGKDEPPNSRWQSLNAANNERANNVQRSKSYISTTNNAKYQAKAQAMNERKHEPRVESPEVAAMKKAMSVSNLSVDAPRTNEKFSQWRDNILKRQEESTKEKQLQSLQVICDHRAIVH